MKVILKEEVLLRDFRDALLSMFKRHTLWTMSYISPTKKKEQTKKAKEKKARGKRCAINRAGIDDRFTARWLYSSFFDNEESRRHDSARMSKNALIFSCGAPNLQEE